MNPITIAKIHHKNGAAMQSSAVLNFESAVSCQSKGRHQVSYWYAIRSLAYSVGFSHPDYRAAWAMVFGTEPVRMINTMDKLSAIEGDEGEYLA